MIDRRAYLRRAGTAAITASVADLAGCSRILSSGSDDSSPTNRPNLLIVMADEWRAQALGAYGNNVVQTPHLDQFARRGFMFERAYTNTPQCVPGRGTLWTGRLAHAHRAYSNRYSLPASEHTIAETLRKAGYRRGYIGKWHLAKKDTFGRNQTVPGADPGYVPPGPGRQGWEWWRAGASLKYMKGFPIYNDAGKLHYRTGYQPAVETTMAINHLQEWTQDSSTQPWALVVSWLPPHFPSKMPARYSQMYDPAIRSRLTPR